MIEPGEQPRGTKINLGTDFSGEPTELIVGDVSFGGEFGDSLKEKYGSLDPLWKNREKAQQYLERLKAMFSQPYQVAYLDMVSTVTHLAGFAARAHKRIVDGQPMPPQLSSEFTIILPEKEGDYPTLLLTREAANDLKVLSNRLKFHVAQREDILVAEARHEATALIKGETSKSGRFGDTMKQLVQKARVGLSSLMVGQDLTDAVIQQTVQEEFTSNSLHLNTVMPRIIVSELLGRGEDAINLDEPIILPKFFAMSMALPFGLDDFDIHPAVAGELPRAWDAEFDKLLTQQN